MSNPETIAQTAHELRNNLYVIEMSVGALEQLPPADDPARRTEVIQALKEEVQALKRNLRQLLDAVSQD